MESVEVKNQTINYTIKFGGNIYITSSITKI